MSVLDEALRYASLGYRVIPIKAGTKRPPMKGWQNAASSDPDTVRKWWGGIYSKAGIGLATGPGSGVWLLDVDTTKGGLETLRRLVAEHGPLPKVPRVDTGSGGFHLYFADDGSVEVRNTQNLAGTGLDVRGDGGQGLLPPTAHAVLDCEACRTEDPAHVKRDYTWHEGRAPWECEIVPAPEWLLDLVTERHLPEIPAHERLAPVVDSESAAAAINQEHDWHTLLMRDGWSIQKQGTEESTWVRPGKDRRLGISAILHEPDGPFVNYSTNAPELCQSWARVAKGDGWAYSIFGYLAATRHNGDRSACAREWRLRRNIDNEADWMASVTTPGPGATDIAPEAPDSREDNGEGDDDLSWAHLVDWGGFWQQEHEGEQWAVWPLVPEGRAVALFAPAKAGKSTLLLAAIAAAATGRSVFGAPAVDPVEILYLDYEMTEGDLWERLQELGYGPGDDLSHLHYALLPSAFPLDSKEGGQQILALAKRVEARVVVIDTFSRSVRGAENDNDTVRLFYRNTGMVLKSNGIAWIRADHTGKDVEAGQRGASAKNDDVDVVWKLTRTDAGSRVERTHSRVSWVPPQLELDRVEHDDGTVAYRIANRRSWPEGTRELAELLQALQVPVNASGREAARVLRENGHSARNDKIRIAQQYRSTESLDDWVKPVSDGKGLI